MWCIMMLGPLWPVVIRMRRKRLHRQTLWISISCIGIAIDVALDHLKPLVLLFFSFSSGSAAGLSLSQRRELTPHFDREKGPKPVMSD